MRLAFAIRAGLAWALLGMAGAASAALDDPPTTKTDNPKPATAVRAAQRQKLAALLESRKGQKLRAANPEAVFKKLADAQETLPKERFEAAIKEHMPRLAERPQLISRLFDRLDANGDGKLTQAEFQKLRGLATRAGQDKDEDKDKATVNAKGKTKKKDKTEARAKKKAERLAAGKGKKGKAKKRGPAAEAVFKKLADGQEALSKERFEAAVKQHLPRLAERPKVIDRVFGRLDANGDGKVTESEFQKLAGKLRRG